MVKEMLNRRNFRHCFLPFISGGKLGFLFLRPFLIECLDSVKIRIGLSAQLVLQLPKQTFPLAKVRIALWDKARRVLIRMTSLNWWNNLVFFLE